MFVVGMPHSIVVSLQQELISKLYHCVTPNGNIAKAMSCSRYTTREWTIRTRNLIGSVNLNLVPSTVHLR